MDRNSEYFQVNWDLNNEFMSGRDLNVDWVCNDTQKNWKPMVFFKNVFFKLRNQMRKKNKTFD